MSGKKRSKTKRRYLKGYSKDLHGAFASESDAISKAKRVRGGYIIKRSVRGPDRRYRTRYIVMSNLKAERKRKSAVPF